MTTMKNLISSFSTHGNLLRSRALLCGALVLPPLFGAATATAATPGAAVESQNATGSSTKSGLSDRTLVLLEGEGIQVTATDVLAEAARAPQPTRDELLRSPNNIAQIASNIYVRRSLAAEAVKEGLLKDPVIEAQLRIARDRVLSDAQLARIDEKNKPSGAVTEQYAKTAYQADPKRFVAPDEVRARHILIADTTDESRAKAEKLLDELKKSGGANFEELARKESADPGSAPNGGDLGYFGRGRMVKPFEDAAFDLGKPGELSGLVESPFGFHIIQLVDRRAAGTRPFAEVEGALREEAMQKALGEARTARSKALLATAKFNRESIEAFANNASPPPKSVEPPQPKKAAQ